MELAEAGAAAGEAVVQRRAPQRPRRLELAKGPVHGVQQPQALDRALAQIGAVAVEAAEPADIDLAEVHRRLAGDDPFGESASGTAGAGDTDRVEAGGEEQAGQLGRLAEDVLVVGREALRAVDERLDPGPLQRRHPRQRAFHDRPEMLPVLVQQREREAVGDALHAPGLGFGLEAADDQPSDFLLVVGVAVGIGHRRQAGPDGRDLLRHDVHVLGRVERHADPAGGGQPMAPHAGAQDHDLAGDVAGGRAHAARAAVLGQDADHRRRLEDAGAAPARALGQRLGGVGGIGLGVARQPQRSGEVVGAHRRPQPAGFAGGDDLGIHAEAPRRGRQAPDLLEAFAGAGHHKAAIAPVSGRLAGLPLERGVELVAVAGEVGQGLAGAQARDEPGSVPCRAAADAVAFEQHDIRPRLGKMVGDAAADDAAADDDGAGPLRKGCRHAAAGGR